MRKLFLIPLLCLYYSSTAFPQVDIEVNTRDSWGPGRFNKVTFRIDFGNLSGFARFTQDFPRGFDIIPDSILSGDFTWTDDQLNIVWIRLPQDNIASFSYLIKPGLTMKGNFEMGGKLVLISGGDTRHTFSMVGKTIAINGTNGLQVEDIKRGKGTANKTNVKNRPVIPKPDKTGKIEYRVQVSLSSSEISPDEIIRRFGLSPGEKVTILKSGKMYKYQVGSFASYDSAGMLQARLLSKGIKDAFIVAYQGEIQVRPEKTKEPDK